MMRTDDERIQSWVGFLTLPETVKEMNAARRAYHLAILNDNLREADWQRKAYHYLKIAIKNKA